MFGSALICMSPYISAHHRDRKTSLWDEIWNNNKIPFLICDSVTYIWEHCLDLTFNSLFLSTSRSVSNRLLISSLPNKIIWGITWKSQWGDNFVCWLLGMGFLVDHNAGLIENDGSHSHFTHSLSTFLEGRITTQQIFIPYRTVHAELISPRAPNAG